MICGLLLDPIVKVAPGYQCLHCEGIAKRSNRNPFAREVEPVSALVPNACRMPGDQGSNTADLILGWRFSGRQFTQPLDRQICRGAISDAYFPPKGSGPTTALRINAAPGTSSSSDDRNTLDAVAHSESSVRMSFSSRRAVLIFERSLVEQVCDHLIRAAGITSRPLGLEGFDFESPIRQSNNRSGPVGVSRTPSSTSSGRTDSVSNRPWMNGSTSMRNSVCGVLRSRSAGLR